jgi:hypothetical protein
MPVSPAVELLEKQATRWLNNREVSDEEETAYNVGG